LVDLRTLSNAINDIRMSSPVRTHVNVGDGLKNLALLDLSKNLALLDSSSVLIDVVVRWRSNVDADVRYIDFTHEHRHSR